MKIAVVGTGYVGLVTGACFAKLGHTVYCIDKDDAKISKLNRGELPIYEPGLDELVAHNQKEGRIFFLNQLDRIINLVDAVFLAVGTPPKADYHADLSAVIEASSQIGKLLNKYCLIVTKSTVPVGTSELIRQTVKKNLSQKIDFDVSSNPEFLRQGSAIQDFMEPDRIVVGVDNQKSEEILREIYAPLVNRKIVFLATDTKSAEIIKYASNSFLAAKISFINEIANFCELVGANVDQVAYGMGLDSRIGAKFLSAGLGYGGSCFPKDVKALIAVGKSHGIDFDILKAAERINEAQRTKVVSKLKKHLKSFKNRKIAIWGLAFKANTDDVRESPAFKIVADILKEGANVMVFDPIVKKVPEGALMADSAMECCEAADALVIITSWEDFLSPDFDQLKKVLKQPLIIDGRNIYDPKGMRAIGFVYDSIGRPNQI